MGDEAKTQEIVLFDLDGVLIQPGGYRAAVKATVNYFARKLGLGDQTPQEEDLALFEANGVTSEWDMVPICTAILVDLAGKVAGVEFPNCSFGELAKFIREKELRIQPEYRAEIERLAPFLKKPGVPAAESLLNAVRAGTILQSSRNQRYMTDLLGDTRHVGASETLRVFQNYILGDEGFVQAYGSPAEFPSESYLKLYDSPLLKLESRQKLQRLIAGNMVKAAVITARPSLAPNGTQDEDSDYSPEAEMAMGLTGIGGIPVVGFGTIQFLGGRLGLLPDSMVKPSPVHTLAGIAAASGCEMVAALDWAAGKVFEDGNSQIEQNIPGRFTLHIFEDSAIGIRACQAAAEILKRSGCEAKVKAWGIARNSDKIKALEEVGANIFPDVNSAIEEAFLES